MEDKALDEAPIWTDLRTFDGKPWRGIVDCITAGYPCQPFSVAGKQKGKDDPRHLWPEVCRIVGEIKPRICFFENVGGHLRLGFEQVHNDLQGLGYKVKAGLFSAEEVGASHKRERLFIMAYRESNGSNGRLPFLREVQREARAQYAFELTGSGSAFMADCEGVLCEWAVQERDRAEQSEISFGSRDNELADTQSIGAKIPTKGQQSTEQEPDSNSYTRLLFPPRPRGDWEEIPESLKPAVCRMDDGLADRVDRIDFASLNPTGRSLRSRSA